MDEDCSPNKVCRNLQGITIEISASSWKDLLKQEGKWQD